MPEGGSRYRGHAIDDPLSEEGWRQMHDAIGDQSPWDLVVSSPMQRCRAFAETVGERNHIPVEVHEDLREVGFGSWEGLTRDEIRARDLAEYEAFYNDPVNNRPAGAEPLEAFTGRVTAVYSEIISRTDDKHLLVVTHAGVIRAIVSHVLQAGASGMYRIAIGNAGISRITHGRYGAKLVFHNGRLD